MRRITVGAEVCWVTLFGQWFTGTVLSVNRRDVLIRRAIGGVCVVPRKRVQ